MQSKVENNDPISDTLMILLTAHLCQNLDPQLFAVYILTYNGTNRLNRSGGSVVQERSPRKREVVGSIPNRIIPKTL